jgi:hypothetical protein
MTVAGCRRSYIPEEAGRGQVVNVPVFVPFPGRFGHAGRRAGAQVERPVDERPGRRLSSRLTLVKAGEMAMGLLGGVPQCAGRVRGRRAAAFIPPGAPASGGRGGMGRARCGQRDQSDRRPATVAVVASKTSDHALPASGPAHPACAVVCRSNTRLRG